MRRREFIAGLGSTAAWPLVAHGQQPSMPVIGFLNTQSADGFARPVAGFRDGLRETGYTEGQNVTIEYRWASGHYDELPALAAELVERRPAVIAATGGTPAALAAKAATTTIPIVFEVGIDPVAFGIVASLNHPGGNLTGVTHTPNTLGPKLIEVLHVIVPTATSIFILNNPRFPPAMAYVKDVQEAANTIGLRLQMVDASSENEIDSAFAKLADLQAGAAMLVNDPFFLSRRDQIVALAAHYAIPMVYPGRLFCEAGGLLSYAIDVATVMREAGRYTGRVLKGEKPADLPVVQAVKVELVLNFKTAKALGLEIPPTLLARADEVIE
jgi:putative tryptophan/tyrosine transport system substrate-binding protein